MLAIDRVCVAVTGILPQDESYDEVIGNLEEETTVS